MLAAARSALAERPPMDPPQLYAQACALCHGADGPFWIGW
jgi:cytochrome c